LKQVPTSISIEQIWHALEEEADFLSDAPAMAAGFFLDCSVAQFITPTLAFNYTL